MTTTSLCSLNELTLKKLLLETVPGCQHESLADLNLGFGWLYYSLARIIRPQTSLVFGSAKGFSPICFALGIKDNQNSGKEYFVDAGYSDANHGKNISNGGIGFWQDNNTMDNLFADFGLQDVISPHIMKTSEFYEIYQKNNLPPIDLLFIDADHTYQGFKYDFETFSPHLNSTGIICFHDALVENGHEGYNFGVKRYLDEILSQNSLFETFTFPFWPGVCLVRKK